MNSITLKVGHTPDADDAFMFYGITSGKTGNLKVKHQILDIEQLNEKAHSGELDVTAISAASYPFLQDKYRILSTGASVGRDYGPIVVTKKDKAPPSPSPLPLGEGGGEGWASKKIAIPGHGTTAAALLNIYAPGFIPVETRFDKVLTLVKNDQVDAGLVIHEGQLTYMEHGLACALNLGELWHVETKLPLVLGVNVIHRRCGDDMASMVNGILRDSINYGLANFDEASRYALQFGRGIEEKLGRQFIKMYVNDDTINMNNECQEALTLLFSKMSEAGLSPAVKQIDMVN